MVGIFLFLTLGVSGWPAILILTTMFPFVASAALILVYEIRKSKGEHGGKKNVPLIKSTFGWSRIFSAGGMIYVILILLVIIFVFPGVLESRT